MSPLMARNLLEPVPFVRRELARLVGEFRKWPEGAWREPSYCPGWSAAHVVAHLGLGADFYAKTLSNGLTGVTNPPYGAPDREAFVKLRMGWMEERVSSRPEVILREFEAAGERLQGVLEGLQTGDLERPAWHPRGLIPIGHFPGMRLFELALHDWDLRVAKDSKATLQPNLLPPLMGALPTMLARLLNQRPVPGLEGALRFRAGDKSWVLSVKGQKAEILDEAKADATVSCEANTLLLLSTGRGAWKEKGLQIEGDRAKAEAILEALFRPY